MLNHMRYDPSAYVGILFYVDLNFLISFPVHVSVERKQNVDLILNAWEVIPFEISVEWHVIAGFRQNIICSSIQALIFS